MRIMRQRWFMVVTVLGAIGALAAPPVKRAASSLGSAKEDEAPVVSPASTGPGPDVALMRGVLWAVEPAPLEIRVQAIEDLGLLGDPRALNVLAQMVVDPNPAIARAALRGLSLIRHPRAEEVLGNVVRHPTLSEAIKTQALESLPFQNTRSAMATLVSVVRGAYPWALQGAARKALVEVPPDRGGLP